MRRNFNSDLSKEEIIKKYSKNFNQEESFSELSEKESTNKDKKLKNLTFSYDAKNFNEENSLKNLNFKIILGFEIYKMKQNSANEINKILMRKNSKIFLEEFEKINPPTVPLDLDNKNSINIRIRNGTTKKLLKEKRKKNKENFLEFNSNISDYDSFTEEEIGYNINEFKEIDEAFNKFEKVEKEDNKKFLGKKRNKNTSQAQDEIFDKKSAKSSKKSNKEILKNIQPKNFLSDIDIENDIYNNNFIKSKKTSKKKLANFKENDVNIRFENIITSETDNFLNDKIKQNYIYQNKNLTNFETNLYKSIEENLNNNYNNTNNNTNDNENNKNFFDINEIPQLNFEDNQKTPINNSNNSNSLNNVIEINGELINLDNFKEKKLRPKKINSNFSLYSECENYENNYNYSYKNKFSENFNFKKNENNQTTIKRTYIPDNCCNAKGVLKNFKELTDEKIDKLEKKINRQNREIKNVLKNVIEMVKKNFVKVTKPNKNTNDNSNNAKENKPKKNTANKKTKKKSNKYKLNNHQIEDILFKINLFQNKKGFGSGMKRIFQLKDDKLNLVTSEITKDQYIEMIKLFEEINDKENDKEINDKNNKENNKENDNDNDNDDIDVQSVISNKLKINCENKPKNKHILESDDSISFSSSLSSSKSLSDLNFDTINSPASNDNNENNNIQINSNKNNINNSENKNNKIFESDKKIFSMDNNKFNESEDEEISQEKYLANFITSNLLGENERENVESFFSD